MIKYQYIRALVHLPIFDSEQILESMITEGNKQKRQSHLTLPFDLVENPGLLTHLSLDPCQSHQTKAEEK